MQISRDASANACKLDQSSNAVTVASVNRKAQSHSSQHYEPPSLPNGSNDSEFERGGLRTDTAFRIDCTYREMVAARFEVCVIDRTLKGERVPISVRAFEFVLIAYQIARREKEAAEINLYMILIRRKLKSAQISLAHLRYMLRHTYDFDSVDEDGRRHSLSFCLREQPRNTSTRPEPKRAAAITKHNVHLVICQ